MQADSAARYDLVADRLQRTFSCRANDAQRRRARRHGSIVPNTSTLANSSLASSAFVAVNGSA